MELLERYSGNYLSVNRFKLGQVLTVGSVFEGVEMELKVDAMPWQAATPSLVGFRLK
ncbi:hypothetical protein PL11201_530043 [Planktothrix sp. PCC 11201]|nr:hypothetical protein PL11201_530043 [Planktothrix sp. PCC 11201]